MVGSYWKEKEEEGLQKVMMMMRLGIEESF